MEIRLSFLSSKGLRKDGAVQIDGLIFVKANSNDWNFQKDENSFEGKGEINSETVNWQNASVSV